MQLGISDFVEAHNVAALNVLVYRLSTEVVLDKAVDGDEVVDDGHHYLQLLHPVSDRDQLGCMSIDIDLRTRSNRHTYICKYMVLNLRRLIQSYLLLFRGRDRIREIDI